MSSLLLPKPAKIELLTADQTALLTGPTPLSFTQLNEVNKLVEDIVENLDGEALQQLAGGSGSDVKALFGRIFHECQQVLYGPAVPLSASNLGYLDKFTANVQETLRLSSLNYFINSIFPHAELNWHHLEWGNLSQLYPWLCINAARDHGKSYYFVFLQNIWRLYRYQSSSQYSKRQVPDLHLKEGMLITSEIGLASKQLEQIKAEIERNDVLYERLYPRTKELWNSEAIRCKNGAMLSVKSYGSKMRGWHPDWITVDDFLTDQALYSQMQRNKYIDFFHSVVMNMLVPKGRIVVVGTPYHSNDLYGDLKKKEGWRVFDYPAIFPDGSLLWQNRHNFRGLMGKRKSQGPIIFSREILVKPVSSDSAILPYETVALSFKGMDAMTLVPNIWSHPKRKDFVRVVTGCDFARSAKVGADFSVFITLGIDEQDRYWLLNVWRKRGASFSEQIAAIRNIHANFKPDLMVMESVQMQQLFVDAARDLNIPVEGHNTSAQSKYDLATGVPSLVILFEQERFKFPRGDETSRAVTDTIALELASITWTDKGKLEGTGEHDDCGMALWMAVQAARKGTSLLGFL